MPIRSVTANVKVPVDGVIRLGVRKEAKSGQKYPVTVHHFVLTDAPDVAKVYGEDPVEIEGIFPMNDVNRALNTWLKWHGGSRVEEDGSITGGPLMCMGDGPLTEIIDGKQVTTPGLAHYHAKKDPVTKVVPTRPCLGVNCPDWFGPDGKTQKCKQSMTVVIMLPRVTMNHAFRITTSSQESIQQFTDILTWQQSMYGTIVNVPYKIRREKRIYTVPETGKKSTQYIMTLHKFPEFYDVYRSELQLKYGEDREMQARFEALKSMKLSLPPADEIEQLPLEDMYPVEDGSPSSSQPMSVKADDVVEDIDVAHAFEGLEDTMGRKFDRKNRLLAVKNLMAKKKGSYNEIKEAVLDELRRKTVEFMARTKENAPQSEAQT